HGTHLKPMVERAMLSQRLQHVGAKPTDRALLDGDEHLMLARKPQDRSTSNGLAEPASATRRGRPWAARAPTASRPCESRVPSESSATLVPSRRMRPLPISNGTPNSGMSTPTPSPRG